MSTHFHPPASLSPSLACSPWREASLGYRPPRGSSFPRDKWRRSGLQIPPSPCAFLPRKESTPTSSCCLPAKKRVWAPHPLSPVKTQEEDSKLIDSHPQPYTPTHYKDGKEEDQVKEKEEAGGEDVEEEDDGVVCAVCQSTDGEPHNPIVFCDGCDLMVHALWYGSPMINSIPEGDWFCLSCDTKSKEEKKNIHCCLCPTMSGVMKPTVDGRWAHILCALLVPEVFFKDPDGRDGIDCSHIPSRRWKKACYVCGTSHGCAIECSELKCGLGFHVSCGLEEGLCIEFKEGRGGGVVAGFCKDHTMLWEKQQLTGKFKIVPMEADPKRKNKTS